MAIDYNKTVTLAHGAGGRQTAELIHDVFKNHFQNPEFTSDDAAILPIGGTKAAFTTDGFIVSPWKFAGGNIGKLSICGTVNDLSFKRFRGNCCCYGKNSRRSWCSHCCW